MKWKRKTVKVGDRGTITKFLWLPKTINHETRWLEAATWEWEVTEVSVLANRATLTSPFPIDPRFEVCWVD